ncbi:helix-turn-helix transcriptional regulator [Marinactinospora rubrisoli]|uniref:Helix-turn-helix transcriptional regulator n=1 Tax=Marinactinospora rubrisoli TaxID=2715399 RepID=A0ABW2K9Z4_9ACTN
MEPNTEIREFLRTRRARITPEQAGLVPNGGARRVPGLRREEVARLAGVSVDYYVRLERGRARGVSEPVLDAVARALRLDRAERAHLFDLARPSLRTRRPPLAPQRVRPVLHRVLEAMDNVPAMIQGRRLDILAGNKLASALYTDFGGRPYRERNMARYVFLDEQARSLFADWGRATRDIVAALRLYAGRHPDDPQLADLVQSLSRDSAEFHRLWADRNVISHSRGAKHLRHPLAGDIFLDFEVLSVDEDPEQSLVVYSPDPSTASAEALAVLAGRRAPTAARSARPAGTDGR